MLRRAAPPSRMLRGEKGPLALPKQQGLNYTQLLELMGRKSFAAVVAGPPDCGSKTLVRSAA
eukprot:12398921-Karenia_brevis.AAC.1